MLYLKHSLTTYTEAQLQRDLQRLPQWRREKALRYRHFSGQAQCTLSYILLLEALDREYNITGLPTFVENEHGKPSLQEYPDIHFNLSHCRSIVACAVDNAPVGIDVEDLGRYSECVARYCMNDDEMSQIGSSDLIFTRLWTQKEAVFKLQGTGIRDNIKDILLPENLTNIGITTKEYPTEGYVLSIARYIQ